MHGAGTKSILAAAVLAAGVVAGGPAARAQEAGPGNSWQPIQAAPAAPPKPAEQLPKESTGDPATKSWAPPGLGTPSPGAAPAAVCGKSDFEAVVDDAAGALRDLNMQNKPDFQEKLRQLKDKRGWSHDAFLKEAAPYVRDDKIAVYDQESERLLSDISSLGQEGAEAPTPDCALLADLKARMKTLVETQTAKWSYMFQKLQAALSQ